MIRLARIEDLKNIMVVIEDARQQLKENNSLQWNDGTGYPEATDILNDLVANKLFVYEDTKIKGCIVMIKGDEDYDRYDIWDKCEYYALHRIAVLKESAKEGIATSLIKHCITEAKELPVRGDTHESNKAMIKTFEKVGFTYKGLIELSFSSGFNERNAYEYKKEDNY